MQGGNLEQRKREREKAEVEVREFESTDLDSSVNITPSLPPSLLHTHTTHNLG